MPRTTDKYILEDKCDWYETCPNCGGELILRNLHRHYNKCLDCNFDHHVFNETVESALNRFDAQKASQK